MNYEYGSQIGWTGGGRGVEDSTREQKQREVRADRLPLYHLVGNPILGVSGTGRTL